MNKTNPLEYEQIAREVFAPIYPAIAEQIKKETGISQGKCLDLGTGTGCLGLAMAEVSDMEVFLLDVSREMLDYARENIEKRNLEKRVQTIHADVHEIPLPDQSIDLVISRGSIFFWDDLSRALPEIYRILAPGGRAFIGGGFGTDELKQQIATQMTARDPEWEAKSRQRVEAFSAGAYVQILNDLQIPFEIKQDAGFWIHIRREL